MVSLLVVVNRQWAKSFVKFELNFLQLLRGVLVRVEAYRQYIKVLPKPPCFSLTTLERLRVMVGQICMQEVALKLTTKGFSREFGGAELLPVMV